MDKRSILAFIIIGLLVMVWTMYQSVNYHPEVKPQKSATEKNIIIKKDSTSKQDTSQKNIDQKQNSASNLPDSTNSISDSAKEISNYGRFFSQFRKGSEKAITIETDLAKAVITSKGAVITKWELKNFNSWNGYKTQLIADKEGVLQLDFRTVDNKKIDSRNLYFSVDSCKDSIRLKNNDSITITARLVIAQGKEIIKRFTFYANKYTVTTKIEVRNLEDIFSSRGYDLVWDKGLVYQEKNSIDETSEAHAIVSLNGEIEEINAKDEQQERSPEGLIDYAAIKSKYFVAGITPKPNKSFDGIVDVSSKKEYITNGGTNGRYSISFRVPYRGGSQSKSFSVYMGPLKYDLVKKEGLEAAINFGWRLLVRPIGEYFMLPIFNFIHTFIPNYGIAIILFSLLMKMILYPLSITQMKSTQKMSLLGPEMNKLKEKFKDDPTAQQKETMKLYSEYGINPMGGCLPLVLQMPILYALWAVLRSAIDLRQAPFIFWIQDLSSPDIAFMNPFPIFGLKFFSGLAILMGITMFLQQKMTLTDPRQKSMIYIMPIMFTFMFSNFPSGLNLYYFMFNLISIVQQVYMNKFSKNKFTLDQLKKMPKKEGWLQRKMREAQDIAEKQGRSVPGANKLNAYTNASNPKNKSNKPQTKGKKR